MDRDSIVSALSALSTALVLIAIIVALVRMHVARAKSILRKWAEREGFEIVDSKRAFAVGPFSFFGTSRNQVVFSVTVRDREGRERSGWVRCGSFFGGVLFSEEAEVKWNTAV